MIEIRALQPQFFIGSPFPKPEKMGNHRSGIIDKNEKKRKEIEKRNDSKGGKLRIRPKIDKVGQN